MNKNNNNLENSARINLIISMVVFGTIGIFRRYIPLSSSFIALARGFIGSLFLLIVLAFKKQKPYVEAFKKNCPYLLISGIFIGFNWILLFEAYNNTSVAIATLCYYMAPVIVILLSPIVLKEKLNAKKWASIIASVIGMVLISGVLNGGNEATGIKGIIFGLGAALLYALVILCNKKITNISPYDKTIYQLSTATIVLIPYTFMTEKISISDFDLKIILLLVFVGIVHTGFTYFLYFGSISNLRTQTVALYSYIDPICAIFLSAVILKEKFGIFELIGTLLILGSTIVCEIPSKSLKK